MRTKCNRRQIALLILVQIVVVSLSRGQDFSYSLGTRDVLANKAQVPIYPWFPDGHIAVVAEPNQAEYHMYWSGHESYRTLGAYPFPEFQHTLFPEEPVFGGRLNTERWDNGGSWLMSIFRQEEDTLVGFYHAEDHWVVATNPSGVAWKSIARTTSSDNGFSWSEGVQIITSSATKPASPTWGGAGDNCVIWDHLNNRWLCYYQEHWLMMAVSYDPAGRPGTWYKYYNGEFNQPGLGGFSSSIPGLASVPGGNPSVHYNSYLQRFVMVWHSWVSLSIYISTSTDGVVWEEPRLLEPNSAPRRAWYPTIIGASDTEAGKIARLYYADIAGGFTSRDFVSKALAFDLEEDYRPQTTWQPQRIGEVPVLGLLDATNEGRHRIVAFSGSMDDTEHVEHFYQDKTGSYVLSGKFQLDDLYNEGSVGLSVRSGLDANAAMAAIMLSPDSLLFRARETAGALSFSAKNALEWTSDIAWLQIEKTPGGVTCRYSPDGEEWSAIGSIPFGHEPSKSGFFATGTPDSGTIAYIEQLEDLTNTRDASADPVGTSFSNPAGNRVFITHPEFFTQFSIYDLNGKLQLRGVLDGNHIDVQRLPPGLYVLNLQGPDQSKAVIGKLVIAR